MTVENISKLKEMTEKPGGERGNWMVRNITRTQAIYFTWLLLHTPINADGVVLISIIFVLSGGVLLSFGEPALYLWGALLLHLWYIFDHVDGQVARYRKETNITGIFFDYVVHYIVNFSVFCGLSLGSYHFTGNIIYLYLGIATMASFTMLNILNDSRAKSFLTHIVREARPFRVRADEIYSEKEGRAGASLNVFLKRSFSIMHKACEVHIVLNVLLAAALINIFSGDNFLFSWAVWFFFAVSWVVWPLRLANLVISKKIDKDFESYFSH